MGHHDDEAVARHLCEDVHDLDAGLGVEGAGGLVGQHDLGVVHEGARDCHALHLPAGKLRRPLVDMVAQAHALERLARTLAALGAADARQGEGQLHVGEHRLVRDEVVALEDEANAVVSVGVPVLVGVVLGGDAVHDDVAGVGVVKAAEDVEEGGLARARRAQHRHELALAKRDGDPVQRLLDEVPRLVRLADVPDLDHAVPRDWRTTDSSQC